jgi:hypothetical protein
MSHYNYKFQVGDIVTKQYGKKVAKVVRLPYGDPNGWGGSADYQCRYEHAPYSPFQASEKELKLVEDSDSSSTSPMNMKTLYSFTKPDGSTGYGTYLATNSTNQLIIEEKGTGVILTFEKDQLEEVLPYTFSIKVNGQETHYLGNADSSLKKGDVVMLTAANSNYAIGVVTGVNTKNRSPRNGFKGVKLVTEEI